MILSFFVFILIFLKNIFFQFYIKVTCVLPCWTWTLQRLRIIYSPLVNRRYGAGLINAAEFFFFWPCFLKWFGVEYCRMILLQECGRIKWHWSINSWFDFKYCLVSRIEHSFNSILSRNISIFPRRAVWQLANKLWISNFFFFLWCLLVHLFVICWNVLVGFSP